MSIAFNRAIAISMSLAAGCSRQDEESFGKELADLEDLITGHEMDLLKVFKSLVKNFKPAPAPKVYFIRNGRGGVKIGFTASTAKSRLSQLQTGQSDRLALVAVMDGADSFLERNLHDKFASSRVGGEWFTETTELTKIIESHRVTASEECQCIACKILKDFSTF